MSDDFKLCDECYAPDRCWKNGCEGALFGYPIEWVKKPRKKRVKVENHSLDPIALQKRIAELEEKNARLRKALNHYACACEYDGEDCGDDLDAAYCGRIVRNALKENNND